MDTVRPVALVVIRRGDEVLLWEGRDDAGRAFHRPVGGRIEHGETGAEAAAREVTEELGRAIAEPTFLGVLEDVFTVDGEQWHEVSLVYEARFADEAAYRTAEFTIDDGAVPMTARWRSPRALGDAPLYPPGLVALIDGAGPRVVLA